MIIEGSTRKKHISIAITTYKTQSYYTYACLESIRKWKTDCHEVIVACHDQSLLLEYYLKRCQQEGLIDKLIWTPKDYGHTMGVNACFEQASGDYFVNIANDIMIGPVIVDDCVNKLRHNKNLGLIGWHWYNEGTFWKDGQIVNYKLRDDKNPNLSEQDAKNIQNAKWFTGKVFNSIGPKWLQLCNTAFFITRKDIWKKVGGFDTVYRHYWADDFLNYAILDQGYDIMAFENKFKNRNYFHEFQYDNVDVQDRRRDADNILLANDVEHYCGDILNGGTNKKERSLLYQIAKSLPENQTILHVGLWRGASLALFMEAMRGKAAKFIGIDCFDIPGISSFSAQSATTESEVWRYLESYLSSNQSLELIKENTLEMKEFPKADVIFVDAGHTKECIENDSILAKNAINKNGILLFHDYGQSAWKDVKPTLDNVFGNKIRKFETIAEIRL